MIFYLLLLDQNSLKKVEIQLAKEEHEAMVRGTMVHTSSATVFLVLGIDIEQRQRQIEVELKINSPLTPTHTCYSEAKITYLATYSTIPFTSGDIYAMLTGFSECCPAIPFG
jgi:hypothetical protein